MVGEVAAPTDSKKKRKRKDADDTEEAETAAPAVNDDAMDVDGPAVGKKEKKSKKSKKQKLAAEDS